MRDCSGFGLRPEFSSHSLRRGMATSAYRAGASLISSAKVLAFRRDCSGYIEDADQFKENAMHSLLRQKK
jgi:hypothetical protein